MSSTPESMLTGMETKIDGTRESGDIVSFSLWRRVLTTSIPAHAGPIDAATLGDIIKIERELTIAAQQEGREPPKFELIIILLPDGANTCRVYSDEYNRVLGTLIAHTKTALIAYTEARTRVVVRDIYTYLNDDERAYLNGLQAAGSAADMAKNKALYLHRHRKHLQIDTNTKIPNFKELYAKTFGHLNQENHMRFNASYYDEDGKYVSVHNKAVYFTSDSQASIEFGETLQEIMTNYCRAHKDDQADKKKNSIYSKVFCEATYKAGLSLKAELRDDAGERKSRYVANILNHPEQFGLTSVMLTAINQTWAFDLSNPLKESRLINTPARYKSMPVAKFMATTTDYQVWENVVKKFFMASPGMITSFLPLATDEKPQDPVVSREAYVQAFRKISNIAQELAAAAVFICNPAVQEHPLFYHTLAMGFRDYETNLYEILSINGLLEDDILNIMQTIEDRYFGLVAEYDSDAAKAEMELPASVSEDILKNAVAHAKEQCAEQVERISKAFKIEPLSVKEIQARLYTAGGLLLGINDSEEDETITLPSGIASAAAEAGPGSAASTGGMVTRPICRSLPELTLDSRSAKEAEGETEAKNSPSSGRRK